MAVQITFMQYNVSGGSGADAIDTVEYADADAAVAAIGTGFLAVNTPTSAATGAALNAMQISVTAIRSIVSL